MIHLVCGYKRTGKDTLVKMFNNEEKFDWVVYSAGNHLDVVPVVRVGFADKLRQEVNQVLNIREDMDYDTFKEIVVSDGKTYRDILIEYAAYRRDQDIDYWVKQVSLTPGQNYMVTDWRYKNEVEFLQKRGFVTTIRVYRSEVPVPGKDVISEHSLDNECTDFLLISPSEKFEEVCKLFPQYTGYKRVHHRHY